MASGLKRTPSVKVQNDVIVPQRLLSLSRRGGGDEWPLFSNVPRIRHQRQPARSQNEDAGPSRHLHHEDENDDGHDPVQEAPDYEDKRRSYISIKDHGKHTSWQDLRAAGRPRRTSDPITVQDRRSVHQAAYLGKAVAERDLEAGIVRDDADEEANPFSDLHKHHGSQRRFPLQHGGTSDGVPSSDEASSSDGEHDPTSHHRPDPEQDALVPKRNGTVRRVVDAVVPEKVQETARNVISRARRNSMHDTYEKAKIRGVELQRKRWMEILFEYTIYTILLCFIYFVLVGMPLWEGAVYWLYWVISTKFVIAGGWSITLAVAVFYAFTPLFILFEKEPPVIDHPEGFDRSSLPGVAGTALLIPCYKSANIVGATLEAALKIFPPSHIFVISNGNSETPLDNTEDVCMPYGVNHIWSPVGSKIVAQFVGCYAAKGFKNVLLIDDDCALPPNFPVVSDRLTDTVRSIGYTIKSVGPNSSKGTWCQQAQDLEYKISGLQRALAGKMGSATFPHGAISLWDRQFLVQTFHDHPGFSVSEDWFFGHSCRRLGGRIKMCTSVFVETETPPAIFFSSGGSRGGFGEMTVFKQRFSRWNFFFVNGMYYNMHYILTSWRLGWWELGTKVFVFQEVYETLLYLCTPFILPISFAIAPAFCGYLLAGTAVLYLANVVIFNEVHLRLRGERVGWDVLLIYYMPYKLVLTLVNVTSCYWSVYRYARYFAKRHPKVIEDEKAVGVVLRLEETTPLAVPTQPEEAIHEDEVVASRGDGAASVADRRVSKRVSTRFSFVSGVGSEGGNRRSFIPGSVDFLEIDSLRSPRGSTPASPTTTGESPVLGSRDSYGQLGHGFDFGRPVTPYGPPGPGLDGDVGSRAQSRNTMRTPEMVHIPTDKSFRFEEEDGEIGTGSFYDVGRNKGRGSWSQNMI